MESRFSYLTSKLSGLILQVFKLNDIYIIERQDIALLEKSPLRALIQEHHDVIKQCNHPCHRQLHRSLCFCSAYFLNAHSVSVFTTFRCISNLKTLENRPSNSEYLISIDTTGKSALNK